MKRTKKYTAVCGLIIAGLIIASITVNSQNTVFAGSGDPIIPVTREDGSGTRSTFNEIVELKKQDLFGETEDATSDKVAVVGSTEEMFRQIELTKNGIGFVSLGAAKLEEHNVKVLSISNIEPTKETIGSGSYVLSRPLQLVYNGDLSDAESDFLRYLKSEGQGVVEETEYVPVRKKGIYLKENVEGKIKISGSSSVAPLLKILAEAYMEENPKVEVKVRTSDSSSGMLDVMRGKSNFGMVSRELLNYEKQVFEEEVIAKDGIAVIVNEENDIGDISLKELNGIYTKNIESWDYLQVYE